MELSGLHPTHHLEAPEEVTMNELNILNVWDDLHDGQALIILLPIMYPLKIQFEGDWLAINSGVAFQLKF